MTPHLRGHVRAYVDRALPPALLHVYDRHLVYCRVCQSAADQERRIVLALRSHTDMPTSLRSALMGLAVSTPPTGASGLLEPSRPLDGSGVPPVPVPPSGSRVASYPLPDSLNDRLNNRLHDRLPTVRPTAPALHRSPVRAAVVASIAAGASVAAAWGLAVAPLQGSARPVEAQAPLEVSSLGSVAFSSLAAAGFMVGSSSTISASTQKARSTGRGPSSGPTASYWVVAPQIYSGYARNVVAPVRMSLGSSAQSIP